MGTKRITISDDAYERLKRLKGSSNMSFSEVILNYTPPKRKLSEIMKEIGTDHELADAIEKASKEMRKAKLREFDLNADS